MKKTTIITWAVTISLVFAGMIYAGINRPIMIDDTTKQNVTGVSKFVVGDTAQFKGVSTWATNPTAGQYIKVSADGLRLKGEDMVSSGVTGDHGIINGSAYKSVAYYGSSNGDSGVTIDGLAQMADAVVATNGVSLPALTQTLPTAVTRNISVIGTLTEGFTGVTGNFTSDVTAGFLWGDGAHLTNVPGSTFSRSMLDAASFVGATKFALSTQLGVGGIAGVSMEGASPNLDIARANAFIGGTSKFFAATGTTVTSDMLGGGMIYWIGATADGVTIPATSSNTPFFVAKDMSGSGLTIFAEKKGSSHQRFHMAGSWGNVVYVQSRNLGHQVSISSVKTGTSEYHDVIGTIGSNWTLGQ